MAERRASGPARPGPRGPRPSLCPETAGLQRRSAKSAQKASVAAGFVRLRSPKNSHSAAQFQQYGKNRTCNRAKKRLRKKHFRAGQRGWPGYPGPAFNEGNRLAPPGDGPQDSPREGPTRDTPPRRRLDGRHAHPQGAGLGRWPGTTSRRGGHSRARGNASAILSHTGLPVGSRPATKGTIRSRVCRTDGGRGVAGVRRVEGRDCSASHAPWSWRTRRQLAPLAPRSPATGSHPFRSRAR